MKRLRVSLWLFYFCWVPGVAQNSNALLWEVSGNELKEPSYLFGTFHLEGSHFTDSLTVVMEKFRKSKTYAGEVIFDSTMPAKVRQYTLLRDSTLEMILGTTDFDAAARWFSDLTGMELLMYNQIHPVVVQMVLLTALQKKIYPDNSDPMDIHFQQMALGKKKVAGLETLDRQLELLFNSKSLRAHGRELAAFVRNREHTRDSLVMMNKDYHAQDLEALYRMMKTDPNHIAHDERILFERNLSWLQVLLPLMREQMTFAAVGALHLPGDNGLISLLRQHGYTVKSLPLR